MQEGAEFLPGPLLRRQCPLARHKVVENAVECRLLFLQREVRWRRQAEVGKQRLDEYIVRERVSEEDRVVFQRIVESVAVPLIFQKSFSIDPEDLQADAGNRPKEPIISNVTGSI